MNDEIKIGDVVEVHQVVMNGPDRWIGAQVIGVNRGSFSVKAISGTFDGKNELMVLPIRRNNPPYHQWRRGET